MTNKLNQYGSPGELFITGLHGCRCHPFESWEDLKTETNKKLEVGDKIRARCNLSKGVKKQIFDVGVIVEVYKENGFLTVLMNGGKNPSDIWLYHKSNVILIK